MGRENILQEGNGTDQIAESWHRLNGPNGLIQYYDKYQLKMHPPCIYSIALNAPLVCVYSKCMNQFELTTSGVPSTAQLRALLPQSPKS